MHLCSVHVSFFRALAEWPRTFHRRLALLSLLAFFGAASALAGNRVIKITAPEFVVPGAEVAIPVFASTDHRNERIGFFHAEYSVDGGATWIGFCFAEDAGRAKLSTANLLAGSDGSVIKIRVRIAFRGGKDGDVDVDGKLIDWDGAWNKWQSPPAKLVTIAVRPS